MIVMISKKIVKYIYSSDISDGPFPRHWQSIQSTRATISQQVKIVALRFWTQLKNWSDWEQILWNCAIGLSENWKRVIILMEHDLVSGDDIGGGSIPRRGQTATRPSSALGIRLWCALCALCTVDCALCTLNCELCTVHSELCTVDSELYTVDCQLCTVNCKPCTVDCVNCVFCTVHWCKL